jgi:hypothetical protein
MTTSATAFLHEITSYKRIPIGKLAYFRARLQDRIYNLVVREFLRKESAGLMTRRDLAERIHKDPAQITRYFASPGNWTLETTSDLLLGVCGAELAIGIEPLPIPSTDVSTESVNKTAKIEIARPPKPIRTDTDANPKFLIAEAA